jgi:adenylate cyclase
MAFWNAPTSDPQQAYNACVSAIELVEKVKIFNNENRNKNEVPKVYMGVGINTGKIVVGNVGSSKRFDYTILGDEVNIASRLEGLTKKYDVPIIIGRNTVEQLEEEGVLDEFSYRLLDLVTVKGRKTPLEIFELMGYKTEYFESIKEHYEKALHLYLKKKFNKASETYLSILNEIKDHPSKMMLIRCYNFIEEKPDKDWNGAWEWASK